MWVDVSSADSSEGMVWDVAKTFGRLGVALNNAGISPSELKMEAAKLLMSLR